MGVGTRTRPTNSMLRVSKIPRQVVLQATTHVPRMLWSLVLVVGTLVHLEVNAQCDMATEQPMVTGVNPPSGTTGTGGGVSSTYTIQGERLDRVSRLEILLLSPLDLMNSGRTVQDPMIFQNRNSTSISFQIPQTNVQRQAGGSPVTLRIYPINAACQNISITMSLHETVVMTIVVSLIATPGTTIATGAGTCLPNMCGDNSTNFDIEIGGITLERFNVSMGQAVLAARFPNFDGEMQGANLIVSTQYQQFDLPVSQNFDLLRPGMIQSVVPAQGQRGTRVVIRGQRLRGSGSSISLSRVLLGMTEANITGNHEDDEIIEIRAGRGGMPGNVSITINTTHSFDNIMMVFNGPYIFHDNAWVQLEDGLVRDIIPPAAQPGRTVLLCGDRLLGGGSTIDSLQFANQATSMFNSTPSALSSSVSVSQECIMAVVPTPSGAGVTGRVTLEADTGALVESSTNFTFADITSIVPQRGQPGTIVTISGVALLSGYNTAMPTVYLGGVQATLMSYNSTIIVARAATPPTPVGSGMMMTLDDFFGMAGDVSIDVTANFTGLTTFSVSEESAWTYLAPGEITSISPNFGQLQTRIVINGTNLLGYGATLVRATVGGVNAIIESNTTSQVILLTPDLGPNRRNATIVLFSDSGAEIIGENLFEYREQGMIVSTEPSQGQNGTYVTITGNNLFGYGNNITSVMLGSVQATIDYTQANNTSITVRASANSNTASTSVSVTIVADTNALVTSAGNIWTYLVPGNIDAVLPGEGQEGTRIEITGTNLLGGGASVASIFLDGVMGNVDNATATRIVVTMRDIGERFASFFPGQVYIMANTGAVVFGGMYAHRAPGQITTFSPQRGRRGTRIVLSGVNLLGFGNMVVSVLVAGMPGTVESFDNTSATIRAGSSSAGIVGPIQLIINTGAVISSTTNFTYEPSGVISEVVPGMGAEGTGLLIRGTALTPTTSQVVNVTIGGNPVSRIVTAADSEISVIVGPAPAMNPNSAAIVITANDGSIVDGESFTFINLAISLPGQNRGQEGTLIDIQLPNLPNFEPSLSMRTTIDDQEAQVINVNATLRRITVQVPRARNQGMFTADVAVESLDRLVARLRNGFTYLPEGTIFSIDPTFGQLGTGVIISGANLLGGGGSINSVSLAGAQASVRSSTNERIEVDIMENLLSASYPQLGDVILTADTGAIIRRLNGFTLVQPGEITSASPMTGQFGTRVTISGNNLLQGTTSNNVSAVMLAGVPVINILSVSQIQIIVQAAGSASAGTPGPIVVVLTTGARIESPSGITFQYLQPGRISTVIPNSGPVGTNVVISGISLLGGGSSISQVWLGGVQATITGFSDTQVSVTATEGTPGMGDIIIISNTGTTINGSGLWTYKELGVVTQVSPTIGQQGVQVTITGQRLLSSSSMRLAECRIAGIVAAVLTFTDSQVVCMAGRNPSPEVSQTGPVSLVTDTGVTVVSTTNFTYYPASIDQIEPQMGNNGTTVDIRGTNLYGYPDSPFDVQQVLFGGIEATILSRNPSNIQVRVGAFDGQRTGDTVVVRSSSGAFLELPNAWNFTQPRTFNDVSPSAGIPGDEAYLFGQSLNLASASSVQVMVGGVTAESSQVINDTTIQFMLGVYQGVANPDVNLPVQVTYSTGETIYNSSVTFNYSATEGVVSSISPQAGNGQVMVAINGTNLLNNQSLVRVSLAGINANVMSATEGRIILEAGTPPSEGSSGPVVIERDDDTLIGLGGNVWTYYPSLMSGNVSPNSGQNGTVVTIDLSQLNGEPTIDRVTLAGVPTTDVNLNATNVLTVRAGSSDATTVAGEITVEFNDNSVLRIPNSWSYLPPVAINNITPPGMRGYFNTSLTLNGGNFQAGLVTVVSVTLAGVDTTIESQNNSQIQVRITRQLNTTVEPIVGPIVIVSSQGATFVSSNSFTYVQVRVDSVSPQMGQRGTRVTVSGVGLLLGGTAVSTFWLGSVAAETVISNNDTTITVEAAQFPTQTNVSDVSYIMNTGAVITIGNSWRYIVPGEIQSVTPTEGNMGTLVTIMGTNLFGGGSSAEMVILNSVPAVEIVTNFDSLIQVLAGANTTVLNPGNVQVISNTGAVTESASSVAFMYLEPGRITAVTPNEGQNGTRVRVSGSYLHNGERIRRVLLAGVEAEIVNINENDMVAGIPATIDLIAGRPSSLGSFTGPVVVESNFNTTTVSMSGTTFTYRSEGLILTVSPTVGQNSTMVTITGQDLFGGGTSVQQAYLAGVEADIVSQTNTVVVVRAGENAVGRTGDVVLISNTNAYVRRIDGWTYIARGVVNMISPPMGQFGTRVTISGERLLLGASSIQSVSFNNISAFSIVSYSDMSIVIRVGRPTSSLGFTTNSITIVSSQGGVLYQSFSWTYTDASQIVTVDPLSGTSLTSVTVTGMNLYGGGNRITSVTVAGIPADTIMSPNSTTVIFRTGLNTQGSMLAQGIIVLESDTGARTESPDRWQYDDDCPPGTFGTLNDCQPCDEECELCFNQTDFDCFTCSNFSLIHPDNRMQCVPTCANVSTVDRECRDACELNQYIRVNSTEPGMELFCYNCSDLCDPNRMCSGPEPTQCGACRFFYNTLNGTCVEECPVGTYSNESNNCLPCDNQCTPEGGCFGPSAAECSSCSNVHVSANLIDEFSTGSHDVCLERCPSLFYLDSDSSTCLPCSAACAMSCMGPSPFDCAACLNNSFIENGLTRCVLDCNQNSSKLYYDDTNSICQRCDNRCSKTEGCFGPTARDCNSCDTPMLEVGVGVSECVVSCNDTHFHNTITNLCVLCDPSCTIGCTGTTAQDCIVSESTAFNAGAGTIAIVIIIILALIIIVVLLLAFLLWSYKKRGGKYQVEERPSSTTNNIELGDRYAPTDASFKAKDDGKGKEAIGIANTGFGEDGTELYTERGPEEDGAYTDTTKAQDQGPELYTDMTASEIKKSEGVTGSQDLLYTDMSPAPLDLPEPDTAAAPVRPPKPGEKPKEEKPPKPEPYYKVPVKKEEDSKLAVKPSPVCPPTPEMYTDMRGGIQEVHLNQNTGLSQDLYDDVHASTPESPKKHQEDQAPLLTPAVDDLYEDTDVAAASAQQYIMTNRMSGADQLPPLPSRQPNPALPPRPSQSGISTTPLPPLPPNGQGAANEQPPALPQRPAPKKRSSGQPLPETPLQKSLSGSSISSQPTSPLSPTSPTSVPPSVDDIYEDTAAIPPEESLYEPIPAREGNQQLIAQPTSQPAPKPGKGNKLKRKKGKK